MRLEVKTKETNEATNRRVWREHRHDWQTRVAPGLVESEGDASVVVERLEDGFGELEDGDVVEAAIESMYVHELYVSDPSRCG